MATTEIAAERLAPSRLFVNGDWQDAAKGATFQTFNPSTGDVIANVASGNASDVDAAVTAARKAFSNISVMPCCFGFKIRIAERLAGGGYRSIGTSDASPLATSAIASPVVEGLIG